jgi:hypothetical protein
MPDKLPRTGLEEGIHAINLSNSWSPRFRVARLGEFWPRFMSVVYSGLLFENYNRRANYSDTFYLVKILL